MNGLNEMYNDYPNSPSRRAATYHTQSLNRQGSRGFDQFLPSNGLYGVDETTAPYDAPRYNDRINATMHQTYNAFDSGMQHAAWNANGFGQNTLSGLGATGRRPVRAAPRAQLPQAWLDPQFGYPGAQNGGFSPQLNGDMSVDDGEELIPTAIVIKNIPFAVKKEQLVDIMTRLNLPLPYAFNYHFDNGVFRGLAFANFTTAEETQAVIQTMNGKDLHGRRLRVEYKKMLPQAERDRIEREKRERRGQLEEQHRPIMGQLQPSTSMSSMTGGSMQARTPSPSTSPHPTTIADMNDPTTLMYWGKLLLFAENVSQGPSMDFSPQMSAQERTIIHNLAHKLNLDHQSHGTGSSRFVRVVRRTEGGAPVLSRLGNPSMGMSSVDAMRRGLHRAATTDFSQARADGKYTNGKLESQPYLNLQDIPQGLSANALRAAKSHADLRSYTPSPSPSTASYPANPANTHGRYEYAYPQDVPATSRPNLTPTIPNGTDEFLANGLGSMNINYSHPQGSPQRAPGLRPTYSWDRSNLGSAQPGAIGSHRTVSASNEESNAARAAQGAAIRQPRGPPSLRPEGSGFRATRSTHRQRGSDELSSPNTDVDALVDQQ